MAEVIGYRRVSSAGQNLDRQELPDVTGRVFEEKATGANRDRPQLYEMIEYVRDGDEVHVHSIDRLARSLRDLEDIVGEIIGKGASIRFLKEGLHFRPDEKTDPFQKLMFQMLGSFAEFERTLIASRRDEGIAKAKADGKYKGRQNSIDHELVYALSSEDAVTADAIAKIMGIGRASVFRIVKKFKEEHPLWLHPVWRAVLFEKLIDYEHHDQVPVDQVTNKITVDIFDGVLEPIWDNVKHWLTEVDDHVKGDKGAFDQLYLETMHKSDHFNSLYHEHGPVEFTAARMDYLLDHDTGYQKIAERTGMPLEAIPAIVETHKGKSWKEKYG